MPLRVFDENHPESRDSALGFGDQLLHHHLPAEGVDDRFHDRPDAVAVLVSDDDRRTPLGVASLKSVERKPGSRLPPSVMQFVLEPERRSHLCELVGGLLPVDGAEVWIRPDHPALTEELNRCWPGAWNCRRLHLMVVDLPVEMEPLATRALDPADEADLAAVVRINNAAFASHPDQAGMTIASVRAKLTHPGHAAAGVRLAEIDGQLNGFCWTQIHHQRALGEISVIGLHPEVHGRGLGAPMTAAGLHWLHSQGLDQAILYVEAANRPAIRTYERLGFRILHDDVSWVVPGGEHHHA